jgi:hypothetical protein
VCERNGEREKKEQGKKEKENESQLKPGQREKDEKSEML